MHAPKKIRKNSYKNKHVWVKGTWPLQCQTICNYLGHQGSSRPTKHSLKGITDWLQTQGPNHKMCTTKTNQWREEGLSKHPALKAKTSLIIYNCPNLNLKSAILVVKPWNAKKFSYLSLMYEGLLKNSLRNIWQLFILLKSILLSSANILGQSPMRKYLLFS